MVQTEFQAIYRILSLGTLLLRAHMEQMSQTDAVVPEITERDLTRLLDWAEEEGIRAHISPREHAALYAGLGTWSHQTLIDASWRTEALGALLWAMGTVDVMPPYDATFTPAEVLRPLHLMRPTGDVFKGLRLRPADVIQGARDTAELWHWRSRTRRIRQMNVTPPNGLTFDEVIAMAAHSAYERQAIPQPQHGDFVAFGKPYHRLNEEEYATVTSIACERHVALNWLCGYGEQWDETPTDT